MPKVQSKQQVVVERMCVCHNYIFIVLLCGFCGIVTMKGLS